MKVLQFTVLLMVLLITTSEGFFFEYPKKVLIDFLHSIKEKKERKGKPEIQHYHVHYYPVVHSLSESAVKAPRKHELEEIYNENLATLGWSNHEYQYVPEPNIEIPSTFDLWKNAVPWENEILDDELFQTVKHNKNKGIYVQIPINQKLIIEHRYSGEKLKNTLLSNLFHKIQDSKNSIHS